MKNVSLILNIVLFLLVGVLFYLHFKGEKTTAKPIVAADGAPLKGMVIAYFDIDSFQENYEFYKIKKKELEGRQAALENELAKDQQNLQNQYIKFQQDAELMTEAEGMAAQQKLMDAKEKLDQKSESRTSALMKDTQEFNDELYQSLTDFLKEYNSSGQYAYILPHSKANPMIMYANPALDITGDVIKGMNERYQKNKK